MSMLSGPPEIREILIPTGELLKDCIDVPRVTGYCRQCPKYATSWACPPFDFDVSELWRSYSSVCLCTAKGFTPPELLSGSYTREELNDISEKLCEPLAARLHLRLSQISRENRGSKIISPDGCHICGKGGCKRLEGLACPHPQHMTPSIEALGIDAQLTLSRYFGEQLMWGKDGSLAPYYIRLGGVLLK